MPLEIVWREVWRRALPVLLHSKREKEAVEDFLPLSRSLPPAPHHIT